MFITANKTVKKTISHDLLALRSNSLALALVIVCYCKYIQKTCR